MDSDNTSLSNGTLLEVAPGNPYAPQEIIRVAEP